MPFAHIRYLSSLFQLTPDENLKFGGAKGGNKYSDESCDVISDTAVLGKLTLANIDSVIQDLHRLGCKRKVCWAVLSLPLCYILRLKHHLFLSIERNTIQGEVASANKTLKVLKLWMT